MQIQLLCEGKCFSHHKRIIWRWSANYLFTPWRSWEEKRVWKKKRESETMERWLKKERHKNETQNCAGRQWWCCLKQEVDGSIVAATTSGSKHWIITACSFRAVSLKHVYKEIKDWRLWASKCEKSLFGWELSASGLPPGTVVDFINDLCILLWGLPRLCKRGYSLTSVDISQSDHNPTKEQRAEPMNRNLSFSPSAALCWEMPVVCYTDELLALQIEILCQSFGTLPLL